MSRQDMSLGEYDNFSTFRYLCQVSQGSKRLFVSYSRNIYVRVFRSSVLQNQYAPCQIIVIKHKNYVFERTSYRYDGLYQIKQVRGTSGMKNNCPFSEYHLHFVDLSKVFLLKNEDKIMNNNLFELTSDAK